MATTEDNLRKTLTFVFCIAGIIIFYIVVSTKIQVMADQTKAKVLKKAAEDDWENFLERKSGDYAAETENGPIAEEGMPEEETEEESLPPSE